MQTNVTMDCQMIFSTEGSMKTNEVQGTVGDRLRNLLRDQGRRDRNAPYTQYELCDMLTGAIEAPNGKRYSIHTSRSVVNRYLNDAQEMTYEIITAICEIFHVSADWLLRGEDFETKEKDEFYSEEANHIGAMVDAMSEENRQLMVLIAKGLLSADERQNNSDVRIAELLQENIRLLTNGQRSVADAHIQRTDQNRRRLHLHRSVNQ